MSKEIKRSVKTNQVGLRSLNISVDGTAGTPVATGFDQFQIASITDSGSGLYIIIFSLPFERSCMGIGHAMLTADTALQITAQAYDRITVQCTDLAGTNADADFNLSILGSDHRFDY